MGKENDVHFLMRTFHTRSRLLSETIENMYNTGVLRFFIFVYVYDGLSLRVYRWLIRSRNVAYLYYVVSIENGM